MKDYSLTRDETKKFISSYIVVDDKIMIKRGNGKFDEDVIPYSIEEEKKILECMKQQVNDADKFIKVKKEENERLEKKFKFIIVIDLLLYILKSFFHVSFFDNLFTCFWFGFYFFKEYKVKKFNKVYDDIKKHINFINYEDIINDKVKNDKRVLNDTSYVVKEIVSRIPSDKQAFTINTMDWINHENLKIIMENIGVDTIDGSKSKRRIRRR